MTSLGRACLGCRILCTSNLQHIASQHSSYHLNIPLASANFSCQARPKPSPFLVKLPSSSPAVHTMAAASDYTDEELEQCRGDPELVHRAALGLLKVPLKNLQLPPAFSQNCLLLAEHDDVHHVLHILHMFCRSGCHNVVCCD